jgi:hypothetical protein
VDNGDTTYTVTIPRTSPYTGNAQTLVVPETGTPIIFTTVWELPVTLASGQTRYFSKYNIGLITSAGFDASQTGTPLLVGFKTTSSNDQEASILQLNEEGDFQPFQPEYVITAGFLDDMYFFIANNDSGDPSLFLYTPADDSCSELVPDVYSLQIALGCDYNPADGVLTENGASANDDEWFYNASGDTPPTPEQVATLQEVRVSVVARGDEREQGLRQTIAMPEDAPALQGSDLGYQYRAITVRVTVRSHPPLAQG